MNPQANFDRIARPYQALEYLTLGRSLERTRLHFLPRLGAAKNALILGDGDGRFLAHLLASYPELKATAVDSSVEMLALLRRRCAPYADRLQTCHCDAMRFVPDPEARYDLVVTHFFLDCFEQSQIDLLLSGLLPSLRPAAQWLFSDFGVPTGLLHAPASMMIRSLYLAFRILTGLRTTQLPQHAATLSKAGLERIDRQTFLGGILTTEIWERTKSA